MFATLMCPLARLPKPARPHAHAHTHAHTYTHRYILKGSCGLEYTLEYAPGSGPSRQQQCVCPVLLFRDHELVRMLAGLTLLLCSSMEVGFLWESGLTLSKQRAFHFPPFFA